MLEEFHISQAFAKVKKAVRSFPTPSVTVISREHDPFAVLVSCIISLRTRDEVTQTASSRLFRLAKIRKNY